MGQLKICPLAPDDLGAVQLLQLSDDYMGRRYPAASNHLESVRALRKPNVAFFGAYLDAELVGCGAVKCLDDDGSYGEIKRLFVVEAHRGKGVSTAIMRQLEAQLVSLGLSIARLEVGKRQPDALGLYRKLGYRERPPYGHYRDDPLSVFMEKRLDLP